MQVRFFNSRFILSVFILVLYHLKPTDAYAQKVSQFDSEPLLKQARISFESHDIQKAEIFLEQYIQEKKQAFPQGYTFGFEAATVAIENLDDKTSIEVVKKLKNDHLLPEDLMLREGIEAALLNAYTKSSLWSEGVQLIDEFQGREKTNFVLNATVLNFNRALASSGKNDEALHVSKQFFGDGAGVADQLKTAGYWMQQNAETAFMLNQPSNGLQILDNIEKISPEYFQANQISIIMLKVNILEQTAKYSEVAKQLALAHDLNQNGHSGSTSEQQLLEDRLKAYQRAGWLDDNYKANQVQVYRPTVSNKALGNYAFLVRLILVVVFLLPPLVIMFFAIKKRASK